MKWEERLARLSPTARNLLWQVVVDMLPLCVYVARREGYDEGAAYDLGIPIIIRCALACHEGKDLANYVRRSFELRLRERPTPLERLPLDLKQPPHLSVYNILEGLSEYDATLLRLYYIGGYSARELAHVLNVSRSTAWRHVRRALKNAKNLLLEDN